MMKKLLFLAALMLPLMALPSCSGKDEPDTPTVESVDGTVWTTLYLHSYTELTFRDGKYIVTGGINGYGTYVQNGRNITFSGGKVLMPFPRKMTTGVINKYDSNMEIVFDADGLAYDDKEVIVKFIRDYSR